MAAVTAKAKRTAAQVRAGQSFAAAGRKKQASARAAYRKTHQGKAPPKTAKQVSAGRAFAAAGRAAQAARKQGKQPAAPKARKLALTVQAPVSPGTADRKQDIHELPVCAAVAVAEHLTACTGLIWADEDILELARLGGEIIPHLLETAAPGFRGAPPCRFWPAEQGPYTITGLTLPQGPHAVLQLPGYVISWGTARRCDVPAEEAWAIGWLTG